MVDYCIAPILETKLLRIENFTCVGHSIMEDEITLHHEIVLPRSGVFTRHAEETITADVNHVMFFNRGTCYGITHPIPGGDSATIFAIDPTALLEIVTSLHPRAEEYPDRPFPIGHIVIQTDMRLIQYWLLRLTQVQPADVLEIEESVMHLIAKLIAAAMRRADLPDLHTRLSTRQTHHELVEQAKLHINNCYAEPINLTDLAAALYSSPFHLSRIFKSHTALPIHAYVQRIRLSHALNILAEHPDQPITHIALDLGFASPSHLSAAFTAAFGITPSAFRRSVNHARLRDLRKILKV